jgi:hypothetical protein
MKITVFCNVRPFSLINVYRYFGEMRCLQLQDRGVSQAIAVSRRIPTAAARVRARPRHVRFVVDKVALWQVFSEYVSFPCQSEVYQILYPHNHPRRVQ